MLNIINTPQARLVRKMRRRFVSLGAATRLERWLRARADVFRAINYAEDALRTRLQSIQSYLLFRRRLMSCASTRVNVNTVFDTGGRAIMGSAPRSNASYLGREVNATMPGAFAAGPRGAITAVPHDHLVKPSPRASIYWSSRSRASRLRLIRHDFTPEIASGNAELMTR